jgi:hypothetical protein
LTAQELKIEKVPWIFVIVFAAIIGFGGTWWQLTTAAGITGRPAQTGSIGVPTVCMSGMTTLPFMALIIIAALAKLGPLKSRLSPTNITYIYIVSLVCSYGVGWLSPCSSWGAYFGARIQDPVATAEYIPTYMAPAPAIAKMIVVGGVPVPWADVFPSIAFWWIYTALNAMMMLSLAMIFRRSWIDVERVPFPHVVAAHELMTRASPKEMGEKRTTSLFSPFVIGLIIGMAFQFPILMSELFPWFPDIYGWRTNTCTSGQQWLTADSPLSGIVGLGTFQKDPLGMAIAYLAPLSISFNTWFWYVICIVILPQIAYTMGYYTGITGVAGCGRYGCDDYINFGPPFKWIAVGTGATLGLTVLIVVLSWRYIVETINAALGRLSPDVRSRLEEREPTSYRITYGLLAVSFILLLIIYMGIGLSFASALIVQLTFAIFWFAIVRQVGMAGFFFRGTDKGIALARLFLWPTAPTTPTKDFVLTAQFTNFMVDAPENGFQVGGNFIASFNAFRMADMTATSTKGTFRVMMATFIIMPLFSLIGWYYTTYTVGLSRIAGNYGTQGCDPLLSRSALATNWNRMPGTDPWVPYFLLGFAITAVLSILHSRFIWFPFEPVGFTLATTYSSMLFGIWSSMLVGWVLKTITLRIGGSKLYEEKGLPVATGFIAGYIALLIPGTLIAHYKFWFPF